MRAVIYIVALLLASTFAATGHIIVAGLVAFVWWIIYARPRKIIPTDSRREQVPGDLSGKTPAK